MNKSKIIIGLIIVCLLSIGIYSKIFIIGGLSNLDALYIDDSNFYFSEDRLSLNIKTISSGKVFRSYKYEIDGDQLKIRIYEALPHRFTSNYGGSILLNIEEDFSNISWEHIYINSTPISQINGMEGLEVPVE